MRRRAAPRSRGARTPRRPEMAALLRALAAKRKMTAGTEDAPRRETTMHHKSPTLRSARATPALRRGPLAGTQQRTDSPAARALLRDRRAFATSGTPDPQIRLLHARARARRTQLEQRRAAAAEQAALAAGMAAAQTGPDLSPAGLLLHALDLYDGLVAEAQAALAAAAPHDLPSDAGETEHLRTLRARIARARDDASALTLHLEGPRDDTPATHDDVLRDDVLREVVAPALAYCLETLETESETLLVARLGMRALRLDEARIAGHRARLFTQYRPMARLAAAVRGHLHPRP